MNNTRPRNPAARRAAAIDQSADGLAQQDLARQIEEGSLEKSTLNEQIRSESKSTQSEFEQTRKAAVGAVRAVLGALSLDPLPDTIDERIGKALDQVLSNRTASRDSNAQVHDEHKSGRGMAAVQTASDGNAFHSPEGHNSMNSTVTANDVLRLAADDQIRVKQSSERYSTTKSIGKHSRSGQPVRYQGRDVELLSQLETAKAGAFFKYLGSRSGINVNLTEHERALLEETIEKDAWCGKVGTEWQTGIQGDRVKALLNDATSGGREIAPEWFDDALVSYPLLHSEILPEVDLRDVPRSNSIEGAAVGNPSVTWGTAEGTALSLFSTTNLVSELNTAIHPVAVAIEVGNDFLSDAAVNVGDMLLTNIGQRMLQELDRVIVAGNGTSEPQGIVNASGIVDITAVNPTTGPLTYDDALNLSFGIAKQYRAPGYRPGFIMTDTAYKRFLAIATGVTGDKRPLFGMNVKSYELVEYPVRIEQTGLDNNQILFGALQKYRLYRRHGVESRFTSEGQTLTLKNTSLLYVRGRFGGRVMDASAFAMTDGAPA